MKPDPTSRFFSLPVVLMLPCCCFTVNLIPSAPTERQPLQAADGWDGVDLAKSRKRVFPEAHPPGANSAWDPYSYCNTPNRSEQAWEGETDHRFPSGCTCGSPKS